MKGKHAELRFHFQLALIGGSRSRKIRFNPEPTKLEILRAIYDNVNNCQEPGNLLWIKLFIALGKQTYTLTLKQNLPSIEQGEEIINFTNALPFGDTP